MTNEGPVLVSTVRQLAWNIKKNENWQAGGRRLNMLCAPDGHCSPSLWSIFKLCLQWNYFLTCSPCENQVHFKTTACQLMHCVWLLVRVLSCCHSMFLHQCHWDKLLFMYYTCRKMWLLFWWSEMAKQFPWSSLSPENHSAFTVLPQVPETVINPPHCSAISIICIQLGSSSPTSRHSFPMGFLSSSYFRPLSQGKKSLDEF